MKHALVTGAAGYIGSNLVDRLLADGVQVIGVDNLRTGSLRFLARAKGYRQFTFHQRDLVDPVALQDLLTPDVDVVFHLAANADVRDGLLAPRRDLEQNVLVTWNVLEAMRAQSVKRIVFSSTASVYGEAPVIPTPENVPFPLQTSLYGASKLAAEAYISAYAEGYGIQGYIFRFVSILGPRYTHGHVYDFVRKLRQNPDRLEVLGNGKQRKSYLHVMDCINAILTVVARPPGSKVEIFNLGTDEYCDVDASVSVISEMMNVTPERIYAGGERGWIGDNPFIFLDCSKIKSTGWRAEKTIRQSVQETVTYLLENPWVYTERG